MTKKNGHLYDDAYQRLLDMKSSPWNKYHWNMDLIDRTKVSKSKDVKAEDNDGG